MKTLIFILTLLTILSLDAYAQKSTNTSIYTSLDTKNCKTLESSNEGAGSYRGRCAGFGGYKLDVLEGDIRQTINVIAPNKKSFELTLWTVVSSGFSSVGQKAEWRVSGKTPRALIVRFNASENPEDSSKITSYLVVAKITKSEVCVTDIIKPNSNQNAQAQKLADVAATKPCLKID